MRAPLRLAALALLLAPPLASPAAAGEPAATPPAGVARQAVRRGGFHFQVLFGAAGGPTSGGLFHNMEIGHTFRDTGWTVGYDHVFVFSRGLFGPGGGSDLFGGHMLLVKRPFLPWLVGKLAVGLGENADLSDGFDARFGVGWLYGLDLHLPLRETSGATLSFMGFHAVTVDRGHQLAFALGVGYTWF